MTHLNTAHSQDENAKQTNGTCGVKEDKPKPPEYTVKKVSKNYYKFTHFTNNVKKGL